jgi:phosphoribosyl 1,2-cyclic phosphate phosphodiesterase
MVNRSAYHGLVRITFLGTAASEGYPVPFCACANCEGARREGGRSLRKRSHTIVDDELLIDLCPDLISSSQQHGVSLAKVRYVLQTHEHDDHLDPILLTLRSPHYGVHGAPSIDVFASQGALAKAELDAAAAEKLDLRIHPVEPFQTFAVGPYRVTSVRAAHAPDKMTALLYLIERDGRALFYATDTGPFGEETWAALARFGRPVDLLAMDHTFGFAKESSGHLNADQFVAQVERLKQIGVVGPRTRVLAHHIAHHSNPPHAELARLAEERGYEPAFDGLSVLIGS